MAAARAERGQAERGAGENPRILRFDPGTMPRAREDEIPWCAALVCWVFQQRGIKHTRSAAAASYRSWGVKLARPVVGCVAVTPIRRAGGDACTGSWSGNHIAFWLGETATHFCLKGGDQDDRVCALRFAKHAYDIEYRIEHRWPPGVPLPPGARVA
jgi:uncharacterized protein (TIGR02594 family)